MIVVHIQGALIYFFRKILQKLFVSFRKCNFIETSTCKFEVKTQKQTFFRTNLFGNIYSALNFLAKGIRCVKLFRLKKSYFQTKYNTKAK